MGACDLFHLLAEILNVLSHLVWPLPISSAASNQLVPHRAIKLTILTYEIFGEIIPCDNWEAIHVPMEYEAFIGLPD